MTDKKKNKKVQPAEPEDTEEKKPGFTVFLGVVLLARALFNVPAIMKVPETEADKMMLVIVLAMALAGAILLFFPRRR